jgi:predicted RNase H-like HicB family nuclease
MPTRRSPRAVKQISPPESDRYPVEIFYSDDDGGFIAIAKDLPGCSAFGKTQAEAATELRYAIDAWLAAARAAGNPIPLPSRPVEEVELPSGKILLRVPRTLHASLIECAKNESVSLNQHLVSVLSASVAMTLLQTAQRVAASTQGAQYTAAMQGGLSITSTQEGSLQRLAAVVESFTLSARAGAYIGQGIDQTENIVRAGESMEVGRLTAGRPVIVEGR